MEIDITKFFDEAAPMDYSASVAEIGRNAGADTWRAAMDDAPDYAMLQTIEQREAFCNYMRGFGAWTDDEIRAWDSTEMNALFIQMISGDMREAGITPDMTDKAWAKYEADENAPHNIYRGDDGKVYYYVGS